MVRGHCRTTVWLSRAKKRGQDNQKHFSPPGEGKQRCPGDWVHAEDRSALLHYPNQLVFPLRYYHCANDDHSEHHLPQAPSPCFLHHSHGPLCLCVLHLRLRSSHGVRYTQLLGGKQETTGAQQQESQAGRLKGLAELLIVTTPSHLAISLLSLCWKLLKLFSAWALLCS